VETREPLQPPEAEQDGFVAALRRGERTPKVVRRTLLLSLLGLAAAAVVPLRSLIPAGTPEPRQALARTSWRGGNKRLMTPEGRLVRADEVPVGSEVTVLPEGEPDAYYATGILIGLSQQDAALLSPDVAPYAVGSLIAFSKLCTHAGCPVGLYEDQSRQLFCPCHQSVFDVLSGAKAVAGPAGRALPQLPLGVDGGGYLIATGDFRGQPGPTYWKQYWRPET
jgi:ubiquinol-cytochrome c reductase iron-sulfur subunit